MISSQCSHVLDCVLIFFLHWFVLLRFAEPKPLHRGVDTVPESLDFCLSPLLSSPFDFTVARIASLVLCGFPLSGFGQGGLCEARVFLSGVSQIQRLD